MFSSVYGVSHILNDFFIVQTGLENPRNALKSHFTVQTTTLKSHQSILNNAFYSSCKKIWKPQHALINHILRINATRKLVLSTRKPKKKSDSLFWLLFNVVNSEASLPEVLNHGALLKKKGSHTFSEPFSCSFIHQRFNKEIWEVCFVRKTVIRKDRSPTSRRNRQMTRIFGVHAWCIHK